MRVEIVTIGDELLLGFTIDTNAAHLARTLGELGVAIVRRTTVGDTQDEIARAMLDALGRADGVITTGGLGPTSDDRSRAAAAAAFNRELVLHEPTLAALRERWKNRGWKGEMPETNRNQAMLPAGATLLENRHGSAPGIWLETSDRKWLAMLPGVPGEMRGMTADVLVPRLRERAGARATVVASRTLRTSGVPESRVADLIAPVPLPAAVELAYLPNWEGVDLRLTIRDVSRAVADERLLAARDALMPHVVASHYGDDGADLAASVLDALRARRWTIATGESCTGGMLGARLTSIPGSSDVVLGGVIAYDNRVKIELLGVQRATITEHGAVSEEVAHELARGARAAIGADVGVGITGVAGPGGGTPEKPVGMVCIAAITPDGERTLTARLVGDRDEIRRRSTQAALMAVRELLRA